MIAAANSRHAPKPGPPMPYWHSGGKPNMLAVEATCSGHRSKSVSGIRLTKTGTPATSRRLDAPPIPAPSTVASSTTSARWRSLCSASAVDTSEYCWMRVGTSEG